VAEDAIENIYESSQKQETNKHSTHEEKITKPTETYPTIFQVLVDGPFAPMSAVQFIDSKSNECSEYL